MMPEQQIHQFASSNRWSLSGQAPAQCLNAADQCVARLPKLARLTRTHLLLLTGPAPHPCATDWGRPEICWGCPGSHLANSTGLEQPRGVFRGCHTLLLTSHQGPLLNCILHPSLTWLLDVSPRLLCQLNSLTMRTALRASSPS